MLGAGLCLGAVLSRSSLEETGELRASLWLSARRSEPVTKAALGIDTALNAPWSVVLPTAVSLSLVPVVGWRGGVTMGALTTVGWYASHLAKKVYRRPRPTGVEAVISLARPDSFPSGHTALATSLASAVAVVLARRDQGLPPGVVALGIAAVVATGASRVYLGAHHVGDVIAAPLIAGGAVLVAADVLWDAAAASPKPRTIR